VKVIRAYLCEKWTGVSNTVNYIKLIINVSLCLTVLVLAGLGCPSQDKALRASFSFFQLTGT